MDNDYLYVLSSSTFVIFIIILVVILLIFIKRRNSSSIPQIDTKTSIPNNKTIPKIPTVTNNPIPNKTVTTGGDIKNTKPNDTTKITQSGGATGLLRTLQDPNLYAAISIDVILRKTIKTMIDRSLPKFISKMALKIEKQALKVTIRLLEKMIERGGEGFLEKFGIKAGKEAAEKLAVKVAEKLAAKSGTKVATKVGEQLAASTELAASTGPAAPFVLAAELAFDILTMGLDFGDAGGYGKMGTNAEYIEIRDGINADFKKAFEEAGGKYPSIIGPLDLLSADEYKNELTNRVKVIMDVKNVPIDPLIKPMIDKITQDIQSKKLTESDTENDSKIQPYIDMIDMDAVQKKASDLLCTDKSGKVTGSSCSYKDRQSCESSYSWPLKENSNETYAEYKNDTCVTSSYAVRGICESNGIPYDTQTGLCKVDEAYCLKKGADWTYNDKIKQFDCSVNNGQNIAELIFGTTIVRGLKQLFDPDQYEKCKPNEFNNVYSCSSCPEGQEINTDLNTLTAVVTGGIGGVAIETLGVANLCYPKCATGFHPFGANICSPDCPNGYQDDGATCRLPLETYGRGAGRMPDKGNCPEGTRDDGTSCWKDTIPNGVGTIPNYSNCPSDYTTFPLTCTKGCGGYYNTSWGSANCTDNRPFRFQGYDDCYKAWIVDCVRQPANTINRQPICGNNQTNIAGLCYNNCPSGYHFAGGNLCEPDGGSGIIKNLFDRQTCNANEDKYGGLCYPKCQEGFTADGCCVCRKGGDVIGKPNTAYGRGFGSSANLRIKKRVIDFSNKNN